MGIVKVASFSVSLDGFGAGPEQAMNNPLGIGGMALHNWVFKTKMFQQMVGGPDAKWEAGVDNDYSEKSSANLGSWILGRNMFGPDRGPWDLEWKGWWGPNPPYHVPVYVLSHHPRKPLEMEGGTVFHFVTDGIESALKQAKKSAGDKDIRIGGGVSTVRQYLQAGLIDEMHLAYSPVFLGKGENLLVGLDLPKMGFEKVEHTTTKDALHVVLKKKS